MHQYQRYLKNVPYRKIKVLKFSACFTINRLVIDAFVTFSVSWEIFNVVLLVVKK